MQDIPNLKYKLALFVGSEAIELERTDYRTWAPVQRPYVLHFLTTYIHSLYVYRDISPTSYVRVVIQIKSGHLPWTKKDQNVKEIDIRSHLMSIGPPKNTSSRCRVGHHPNQSARV